MRTCKSVSREIIVNRLRKLTELYGLDQRQHGQLATLLEVLAGEAQAPTAVRSPEQAVDVHIADSLVALELEVVQEARTIADLGAGAGFPGLPLAVALPGSEVSLIDSQSRKCEFLDGVLRQTGVRNARAVCVRVEEWHEGSGVNDVVLARALAAQTVVLEYAAPLLRLGGALVDWRGRRESQQEDAAEQAAGELGLERVEVRRMQPWPEARDHHLHVYEKVRETPERFPRRPGLARKRPLGHRGAR
jgi:16S rRNA (guanine527-N7)-methyltransferase